MITHIAAFFLVWLFASAFLYVIIWETAPSYFPNLYDRVRYKVATPAELLRFVGLQIITLPVSLILIFWVWIDDNS